MSESGNLLQDAEREKENKPVKPVIGRDRLIFRTDHLQNYQILDDAIALEGKDFTPLIKAAWYCILGIIKPKFVKFRNIETDTRFNLFIPIPPGAGKNNIKQGISKIVSGCRKKVRVPTSFHPEQLIGKIMAERFHNPEKEGKGLNDTRFIPNYGYLKSDCLIFDEAYNFVTRDDKQYDESKAYIRIALDPIGRNLIQKKLIDNLDVPEQRLEYHPHCTIVMFLQPDDMDGTNVKTGFLRRFNVPYIPLVGKNLDRKDEMRKYLKIPRPAVSFDYWRDIDEWDAPTYLEFEDGIDDLLYELHNDLITYMRSLGEKHRQYLDRKAYAIHDDVVGMAAIQAMSRKSDVVMRQDVIFAYMDYFELMMLTLDYVDAKIRGNIDFGEEWHGAEAKEIKALKWLVERGAIDAGRSDVTIKEWLDYLGGVFEVGEEAARKHHQALKNKRKLIDTKQTDQYTTRVWITFDPDQVVCGAPMPLADTLYWKIAKGDGTLPPLPPLPTDSEKGFTTPLPPCQPIAIDNFPLTTHGDEGGKGGKGIIETDSGREGGKYPYHPETIAGDLGGKGGKGGTEVVLIEKMKKIDLFFRGRSITYADTGELVKYVPEIADELKINRDVAFRSVMQYGKDRNWI